MFTGIGVALRRERGTGDREVGTVLVFDFQYLFSCTCSFFFLFRLHLSPRVVTSHFAFVDSKILLEYFEIHNRYAT